MTANPGGGDYRPDEPVIPHAHLGPVGHRPPASCPWCSDTPVSVAQDATDATETPARTPGGSEDAEARTEAQGEADALRGAAEAYRARVRETYWRADDSPFHSQGRFFGELAADWLRARADEIDAERESATDPGMTNLEAELVTLRAQVAEARDELAARWDVITKTEAERDEARAQVARAWDEGHRTRWIREPDDCMCGAWHSGECGCGKYGTGRIITPNPYRTEGA